uniref:Uncharacterized protein n=1 Tax=Arundo donax TaxID=35708 RepID=A0A0A9FDT4_ARUDO
MGFVFNVGVGHTYSCHCILDALPPSSSPSLNNFVRLHRRTRSHGPIALAFWRVFC